MPAPGKVRTQASPNFLGTAHRTALLPLAVPTPVMPPAITCVELTGIPMKLAARMTADAEASAAKPCIGVIFVIEKPIVLMILKAARGGAEAHHESAGHDDPKGDFRRCREILRQKVPG